LDLGREWWTETGLPFAFAVWQTTAGAREARRLLEQLLESLAFGQTERLQLAQRYASHFGTTPDELARYWDTLTFDLDEAMIEGLTTFYRLGHEVGDLPAAPPLRWIA